MSLKNLVTPLEIDQGTFGLLAQLFKHYATPGHIQKNNFSYMLNINKNNYNFTGIVFYYE